MSDIGLLATGWPWPAGPVVLASWSWGPGQRQGAGWSIMLSSSQLCGHDVMVQTSAQAKPMPPIQIMDTPTVTVHSVLQRHHFLGKILLDIGGLAKRAHPARARYLNVNLARRNRDLQPGGTEIESLEEKSDSL